MYYRRSFPIWEKGIIPEKLKRTYDVFGFSFVMKYGTEFLMNKLNPEKSVEKVLSSYGIPIIHLTQSINHKSSLAIIERYMPDLLVLIAGNSIFKQPLIDLAPKGCINLHTALLPKYHGLMSTFWVLKNGEKETGVSIFFVDEDIDSGPIIVQKRFEIGNRSQ